MEVCAELNEYDSMAMSTPGRSESRTGDIDALLCKYHDMVKAGLAHNKCAFLVLDRCDMTLDEYLRRGFSTPASATVFKSIMFMVVHAVYVIHKVYPRARHYDLHTDNLMLKVDYNFEFSAANAQYFEIHAEGKIFYVPYFGVMPKIIDFGFSILPEEGIVSKAVEDKLQMYFRSQNDLLVLFYWIYQLFAHRDIAGYEYIDSLLSSLEPNRTFVSYNPGMISRIENKIPTYVDMITNKVWDEYTAHAKPSNIFAVYKQAHSAPVVGDISWNK
jgi:serine/threonine protein kinase